MCSFKISGSTACYYKLNGMDPHKFLNDFKTSLMSILSLRREDEGCLIFREGVISNLSVYDDSSCGQFVVEVLFDDFKSFKDLFIVFNLLFRDYMLLCRLILNVNVLDESSFLKIMDRIKRLKTTGLIEISEEETFRCFVAYRRNTFNIAFYAKSSRIEVIADLNDNVDLLEFKEFMEDISRKSLRRRLLDSLKIR